MKNNLLALLTFVSVFALKSQTITPWIIASAGAYATGGTVNMSYTIGEMTMVETFTSAGNILTQGFQQPDVKITGLLDFAQDEFGSFVVYPNPAVDDLWFGFQLPEEGKVQIILYDAIGQQLSTVYNAEYESGKITQPLDVSAYPAGIYLLTMKVTTNRDSGLHSTTKKFQVIH